MLGPSLFPLPASYIALAFQPRNCNARFWTPFTGQRYNFITGPENPVMAPPREPDKVQREIEELLDRLDNFVPEERLASKIRKRHRDTTGPGVIERGWRRLSHLSLGQVMLAGLAIIFRAWMLGSRMALLGSFTNPLMILGIVLVIGAFVLSVVNGDSRRTIAGGRQEKRWRGQVIDYSEPSPTNRIRDWFRRRRR